MTKENLVKSPRGRVKRNKLGVRNVLTVREEDKDPDFRYRVVNDTGDRVAQFQGLGYDVVLGDVQVGDRRVSNPNPEGSPVQISVGGGMKGILMRIPEEYFLENQAIIQEEVNRQEASIRKPSEGLHGEVSISR